MDLVTMQQVCDDSIEHILGFMDGNSIVRFGLVNKRYFGIVTRYLRMKTNEAISFSFPIIISIVSRMYDYYVSQFELNASDFKIKYIHNADEAINVSNVSYIIDIEYHYPYRRRFISFYGNSDYGRRSFEYNDKMFQYAMEMIILNYINNRDFPNLKS